MCHSPVMIGPKKASMSPGLLAFGTGGGVLVGLEIARRDASRRAFVDRAIESDQCVVATIEGRAVAYAVFNDGFYARGFVEMLCVQQDFRRRGIGTALMRQLITTPSVSQRH
jgi:GNAT superfamily N-acetyltransferase